MSQSNCLSDIELSTYQSEGFLIRESVFSLVELESFRIAAERACEAARNQSTQGKTYILDNKRFVDIGYLTVQFEHQLDTDLVRVIEPVNELEAQFDRLIDDSRLVAPMQSILASEALSLWTAKLNLKPAQLGSGFGWHQDSPYWVHDSDHVDCLPNVMVTFDDANLHNGCLQVIRRSHQAGCLPGTDDGSQLGGFFTDQNCYSEQDAVAMEVPAGSLIFFSPHAIHGSGPNRSDLDRRAVIVTYQPANFPALKSGQVRNIRTSANV